MKTLFRGRTIRGERAGGKDVVIASFLPSIGDWGALLVYLLTDPMLFVHQTTVMTAGAGVGMLGVQSLAVRSTTPLLGSWPNLWAERILKTVAPGVTWILTIFAVGSLGLSAEIWIRFHASIPSESDTQLASGIGHFALGALIIWRLRIWCRGLNRLRWSQARTGAGIYWALQIKLLEPPWFSFQGQREQVLGLAISALTIFTTWAILDWLRLRKPHELEIWDQVHSKG